MRAAVLGHPIGHSKSPLLHRAAYAYLGWDCSYDAIDVDAGQAMDFAARVRSEEGWAGLSVTMPLKAALLPAMDRLSETARGLGVLNTVTFDRTGPDAELTGHNTDVAGIVNALRHAAAPTGRGAVVLGSGGTACAAVAALAGLGFSEATVCARRFPEDASGRVGVLEAGRQFGVGICARGWETAAGAAGSAGVVISTLPPHGADQLAAAVAAGPDVAGSVLLDVAYDPWPCALAAAWQDRGGIIVPGLEMLLYQAVEQVRLFAGPHFRDEAAVINVMCDAVGAPLR